MPKASIRAREGRRSADRRGPPRAQLGDREIDAAGPRLPTAISVAIAVIEAFCGSHACWRPGRCFSLQLPWPAARRPRPIAKQPPSGDGGGMRTAAKARSSRTRSPSAPFSINSIRAILSSVIVISGRRLSSQPNPSRRPTMTASAAACSYTTRRDTTSMRSCRTFARRRCRRRAPSVLEALNLLARRLRMSPHLGQSKRPR
jgi:hypothetical protein